MLTAYAAEKVGLLTVGQILRGGKRVICVFQDLHDSLYDPANGILRYGVVHPEAPNFAQSLSNLDVYDEHSYTQNSVRMMTEQLNLYHAFCDARRDNGQLFLLSYTLTLSERNHMTDGSGSVLGMA